MLPMLWQDALRHPNAAGCNAVNSVCFGGDEVTNAQTDGPVQRPTLTDNPFPNLLSQKRRVVDVSYFEIFYKSAQVTKYGN